MTQIDRLITAVKENPEGVLLFGAAVALILRKATSGTKIPQPKQRRKHVAADERETSSPVRDYIAEAKESAVEYADVAKTQAKRTLKKTKRSAARFADNQPLGLALGGMAAGIILAAIFPATQLEQRTLGPLGRRASDMAADATDQVKDMAQAVGDGIKDAARDGLAEAAQQFHANLRSGHGQA